MKLETVVYDKIKKSIPESSSKTILFANVTAASYEIFFYSLFDQNEYQQCYELAENGMLDTFALDEVFSEIAACIKEDHHFHSDSINIFTFIFDKSGVSMNIEYFDKGARIYRLKKEWKEQYLV